MNLTLIWAGILSFAIIMYVLLDGFDLGIGILFPWVKTHEHRDIMMTTVAPIWDGNETWLVFGAAALYGAFPLAYSTLLPNLYMPIMLMLAALIFRGIAFEFRFKSERYRYIWDASFCFGSTLAAFMQGVILGTFVQGYQLDSTGMVSSSYHWLTPFSLMTGIAVVNGYALLGSTWLVAKTVGELQSFMRRVAQWLLLGVALFMFMVSIWTPLSQPEIMQRWISLPNLFYLAPLPITAGLVFIYTAYSLRQRHEHLPFWLVIALFVLAYAGFCISLWPYVVPRVYTLWQAAAPASTQQFILVGTAILLPVLLGYTAYAYYVFRGKVVKADLHY